MGCISAASGQHHSIALCRSPSTASSSGSGGRSATTRVFAFGNNSFKQVDCSSSAVTILLPQDITDKILGQGQGEEIGSSRTSDSSNSNMSSEPRVVMYIAAGGDQSFAMSISIADLDAALNNTMLKRLVKKNYSNDSRFTLRFV